MRFLHWLWSSVICQQCMVEVIHEVSEVVTPEVIHDSYDLATSVLHGDIPGALIAGTHLVEDLQHPHSES